MTQNHVYAVYSKDNLSYASFCRLVLDAFVWYLSESKPERLTKFSLVDFATQVNNKYYCHKPVIAVGKYHKIKTIDISGSPHLFNDGFIRYKLVIGKDKKSLIKVRDIITQIAPKFGLDFNILSIDENNLVTLRDPISSCCAGNGRQ